MFKDIKKIEKPWGYELLFAKTDKYAGKLIFVKKGEKLSYQYHLKKDETMFLFKGKALLITEENTKKVEHEFNEFSAVHFPPGKKHRIIALEDCYIFEVSTPELDDVVRLEDDYGR